MQPNSAAAIADEQIENWIRIGSTPAECMTMLRNRKPNPSWCDVWQAVWRETVELSKPIRKIAA